jgi:type I restriction enzyme M protein
MDQLIDKIQDQLKIKGYSQFDKPFVNEEDNSTIFLATGQDKNVYVKILPKENNLSPQMQEASLFEAQSYHIFPEFVWATNGEKNYYADCFESEPLAEIPTVLDARQRIAKKTLTQRERWSREIYQTLQERFDQLHERLYGPSSKDNISSTNEAIDEFGKFIFMESFRLSHSNYILKDELEGICLHDILDYNYIAENGKEAVTRIRAAFKQIKNHEDYMAINDDGEKCSIFSEDEYLKLENPANYIEVFKTLQDLDEFYEEGIPKKATLQDLSADVLGRVYDVMLRGKYDNKVGQATYLTPREVTEAMVAMALHDITSDPQDSAKIIEINEKGMPTLRILDPTCGSGGFLIKAYEGVRKYLTTHFIGMIQETVQNRLELMKEHSFVGADSSKNMILKARINMVLHGAPKAPIFWVDNSLTSKALKANHYDLILTNPPFGSGSVNNKGKEGKAILDYFCSGIDPDGFPKKEGLCLGAKPNAKGKWKQVNSTDQAILFIDRNLQLLKPGGYLMIVLPDGVLSNSGYKYVREYLMGKKNEVTGEFEGGKAIVKAVVSLPTATFSLSGTGAKTSFLYLRKKKDESEKQGPIFMAVADEIGFDVKNKVEVHLGNDRNDLLKIVDAYKKGMPEKEK